MNVLEIIIVAVVGGGGLLALINQWLDSRAQKDREETRALREVRTPLYRELLRPWAVSLAAARTGQDPVEALAGTADSPEYQLALFEFSITASDDLVRSFGTLMLAASLRNALPEDSKDTIDDPRTLLAEFVFQLRRDLGPRATGIEPNDLIRVLLHHSGNAELSEVLRENPQGSKGD